MAAPKGNQFWKLRSKHGRDKLFADASLLWEAATEYFEWCDGHPWNKTDFKGKDVELVLIPTARPYSLSGLCLYLGCNSAYFRTFKAQMPEGEEDFNTVISRIEEVIYTQQFEGATVGAYNANIIARNLGLADKKEVEHSGGMEIKNVKELSDDELASIAAGG